MILAMLGLIDAALVASLLVMVMISSYENYVSRLENANAELSWLGKLDSGSLKIKVASSIVAISSIHLLQVFLNADQYTDTQDRHVHAPAPDLRGLGAAARRSSTASRRRPRSPSSRDRRQPTIRCVVDHRRRRARTA